MPQEQAYLEIEINGTVSIPDNIDSDDFYNKFIEFVESLGATFGGSVNP